MRRRSGPLSVGLLLVLISLAYSASAASAADTVIGETTLTPNAANDDSFTQNSPVFQGDASGNYVLSAPSTGTLTSWSFLSGGVAPGSTYELAVLAPLGTNGQTWQLTAVSGAESVTSAAGTDAVMGPYALSPGLAIGAGSRIALLPVNTSTVPIEHGVIGADGVRMFPQPFAGLNSSETISPGSEMDNGQVVAIQATLVPTPASDTAPPSLVTRPSISGTPSDGHTLSCALGSWSGSPTLTNVWLLTSVEFQAAGGSGIRPVLSDVTQQVGSATKYVVPDLAPGDRLTCAVTARNAHGSFSAQTAPVSVTAVRPVLAPPGGTIGHSHLSSHPRITLGVGVGGINHCASGIWLHHPTRYAYEWHLSRGGGRIVSRKSTYKPVDADIGHQLYCTVIASNSAGGSLAAKSRTYVVPRTAPKALHGGGPTLSVGVSPNPPTRLKHRRVIDGNSFALRCEPGTWNLPNLKFSYSLVLDGAGTVKRSQRPRLAGLVLPLPSNTAHVTLHTESKSVPIDDQPFLIEGSQLSGPELDDTVQCEVTATAPNGLKGTALTPAALLAGPV
jgi:hypothetical protein